MNQISPERAVELCDAFLAKFEAIPYERWVTGSFRLTSPGGTDMRCALGHCGVQEGKGGAPSEAAALSRLFARYLGFTVAEVNDGQPGWNHHDLPEEIEGADPRTRTISALRLIRAKALAREAAP
jgi:hypothetical protein